MRLLYLAQKPVGERGHDVVSRHIVGVVSNQHPTGWWGSAALASFEGPFLDTSEATEEALLGLVATTKAEGLISVQHPRRIPRSVLEAVDYRAWNLHLAPLPAYRGFNGPTWAILRGDASFGATLHWIDSDLDTGEVAYVETFSIARDETARGLYGRAEATGLDLLRHLVADLELGSPVPRVPQQSGGAYWRREAIDDERQIMGWDELDRKARAFHFPPFPPAYVEIDGRRIEVRPSGDS